MFDVVHMSHNEFQMFKLLCDLYLREKKRERGMEGEREREYL